MLSESPEQPYINPDAQAKNDVFADSLDNVSEIVLPSGETVDEEFVTDLLESDLGDAAEVESVLLELNDSGEEHDRATHEEFNLLPAACLLGRDYTITVDDTQDTDVAVLSIHGGAIESPTSIISGDLASLYGWNRYDFAAHGTPECLQGKSNLESLHVTSEKFNEPQANKLVTSHPKTISLHGFGSENYRDTPEGLILVGGKNRAQIDAFISYVEDRRELFAGYLLYPTVATDAGDAFGEITGSSSNNIVNRNPSEAGLQLELTYTMREQLSTNNLTARDEDLLRLEISDTDILWSHYLDGGDLNLGKNPAGDLDALAIAADGNLSLSTRGNLANLNQPEESETPTIEARANEVVELDLTIPGAYSAGQFIGTSTLPFLNDNNLDAISFASLVDPELLGQVGGLEGIDYRGDPDNIFFSLSDSTNVSGVNYRDDDIVVSDGDNWQLYFDGSDLGLSPTDIDAFDIISPTEILFSVGSSLSLDIAGTATEIQNTDILKFTATSLGEKTAGSLELYLDGDDAGLSTAGENIDALQLLEDDSLIISTAGTTVVDRPVQNQQLRDIIYGGLEFAMQATDQEAALNLNLKPFGVAETTEKDTEQDIAYLSLTENAEIRGIPYSNEDIFGYDRQEFKLLFDGSDLGMGNLNIDAFDIISETELLLSFSVPTLLEIDGVNVEVDDSDILKFEATSWGQTTTGSWSMYLDGSEYGLINDSEDVDGIQLLKDRSILISTIGSTRVANDVLTRDEDLLRLSRPRDAPAQWSVFFDGHDVDLGTTDAEDIKAVSLKSDGQIDISLAGAGQVRGRQDEVIDSRASETLSFMPQDLGVYTNGIFQRQLNIDGTNLGFGHNSIDGLDREAAIDFNSLQTIPETPSELLLSLRPPPPPEDLLGLGDRQQLFFSLNKTMNNNQQNFQNEDIIVYQNEAHRLYFDGSDVGIAREDIDAFDIVSDTEILMSFSSPTELTIDGAKIEVDDSDIVKFNATQLGRQTIGEFELFLDGSEYGLLEDNEDLDGLQLLEDGSILISLLGSSTSLIEGLSIRDEDILRLQLNDTDLESAGSWSVYLDGSDVNLNSSDGGDIEAITLNPQGDLHFSTRGEVTLEGNSAEELAGKKDNVVSLRPSSLGLTSDGAVGEVLFDGASAGLDIQSVDGIALESFVDLASLDSEIDAHIAELLALRPSADPQPETTSDRDYLFFSMGDSTTIDERTYEDEDIVAFDGQEFKPYFDGSNVDLSSTDIDAFDIINDREVLLSFNTPTTIKIDGVDTEVDDSDIVKFTGQEMGLATRGSFELFLDGSNYGLDADLEDIDGLQLLDDGSILISTIGSSEIITDITTSDEDILRLEPSFDLNQAWSLYFDGSNAELGNEDSEDISGLSLNSQGELQLSTIGQANVTDGEGQELVSSNSSVLSYSPSSLGEETKGSYEAEMLFDGTNFDLGEQNIDALSVESLVDFDALGANYVEFLDLNSSEFTGSNPEADSQDAVFLSL